MNGIDISPEISGFRTSASQYFPCDFKLPSEASHLFIICFVNWGKGTAFIVFVYGELCCNGGCRIKPGEVTPAEMSHCFFHISVSLFNVLDSQDFKEPFHSRLGQGEISHFPRDKFSSALPNAIAGTECKVAQMECFYSHRSMCYPLVFTKHFTSDKYAKRQKNPFPKYTKENKSLLFIINLLWIDLAQPK